MKNKYVPHNPSEIVITHTDADHLLIIDDQYILIYNRLFDSRVAGERGRRYRLYSDSHNSSVKIDDEH